MRPGAHRKQDSVKDRAATAEEEQKRLFDHFQFHVGNSEFDLHGPYTGQRQWLSDFITWFQAVSFELTLL